jgi:hypothetical protein
MAGKLVTQHSAQLSASGTYFHLIYFRGPEGRAVRERDQYAGLRGRRAARLTGNSLLSNPGVTRSALCQQLQSFTLEPYQAQMSAFRLPGARAFTGFAVQKSLIRHPLLCNPGQIGRLLPRSFREDKQCPRKLRYR